MNYYEFFQLGLFLPEDYRVAELYTEDYEDTEVAFLEIRRPGKDGITISLWIWGSGVRKSISSHSGCVFCGRWWSVTVKPDYDETSIEGTQDALVIEK